MKAIRPRGELQAFVIVRDATSCLTGGCGSTGSIHRTSPDAIYFTASGNESFNIRKAVQEYIMLLTIFLKLKINYLVKKKGHKPYSQTLSH